MNKSIEQLVTHQPVLLEALTEIKERLEQHPAYEPLTEEQEIEIGGDTAELSYLVRIASAAIAKVTEGKP